MLSMILENKMDGRWAILMKYAQKQKLRFSPFPQHVSMNSITVLNCKVTGEKKSNLPEPIWCVDKQIFHGASGGVVLDQFDRVIGVVEAGANIFTEDDEEEKEETQRLSGFIPINRIIADYKKGNYK